MKTAKNDCAGCRKCSDRRQFFISGAFRSEFPFGSGLGQTEKPQNSPSEKVTKTQKNPAEINRFQPDLVGVSGFEPTTTRAKALETLYFLIRGKIHGKNALFNAATVFE